MRGLSLLMFAVVAGCTQGGSTPDMTAKDLSISFPMGCTSGAKEGDETDVDCGGSCAACDPGRGCLKAKDCASGFCTNKVCDAPSCSDGVKNGKEADLDCGGGDCPGCDVGKACGDGADCKSTTCTNGACAPSPCTNGKQDGMETDVDCGGPMCTKCGDEKMCGDGSDCVSGMCTNGVCKASVVCMPGTANCDGNATNGCEVNTNNDPKNCGKCGTLCPMNKPACIAGICVSQTTMSWTDMNNQSCSGMISTEIQKIANAMPQGKLTVTITATQARPKPNYSSWSATFPNTDCVRKWLSVWGARDFVNYNNWNPGVCQATDTRGTAYIFVANVVPQLVIYPVGAMPAEFMKVYIIDRSSPICDLAGVDNRPGFNAEHTNTSDYGSMGDTLSFTW